MTAHPASHQETKSRGHYARLYLMMALSFIAMYVLMYVRSQQAEIDLMKRLLGGATAPAAADSGSVASVALEYHAALANGDSAAALALLGDDAVILESGDLETREEYRTHHLPADIQFARAVPSARGPVTVFVRSNVAWAVSTSTARGTFRDRSVNSQGAELMVLTREREGWKIQAIHWSSHALRQ